MPGTPETGSGRPIRVMVVDDSSVFRRFVSNALADVRDVEVVGTAVHGQHALSQLEKLAPDVIILDIEMPELDGLGALPLIMKERPTVSVIMFSSLTARGAEATLEAMDRGAVDYALKPDIAMGQEAATEAVQRDLLPLISTWGRIAHARGIRARTGAPPDVAANGGARSAARWRDQASAIAPAPSASSVPPPLASRQSPTGPISGVVIGASTGGPNAISEVLAGFPADLPVPVLVVLHMPGTFTGLLAKRLNDSCRISIVESSDGDKLKPGCVYIAKGGAHLAVKGTRSDAIASVFDGPAENFCKPSVDVLFRSAADVWKERTLAIVLTGMGADGLEGSRVISKAGGTIYVQDESSSIVWGMAGSVASAGLAGRILPLREIASAIVAGVKK